MDLLEYHGKKILEEFGIKIPLGVIVSLEEKNNEFLKKISTISSNDLVVKAQTRFGKRKEKGGIIFSSQEHIVDDYNHFLQQDIITNTEKILIEQKLDIQQEFYLSLSFDFEEQKIFCLFSEYGGGDIEEVSEKNIYKVPLEEFCKKFFNHPKFSKKLYEITKKMEKILKTKDALLVEINPLVLTKNDEFIAADAKIVIDDNAVWRQQKILDVDTVEQKKDMNYMPLKKGGIGTIGNGAGLAMSLLDRVQFQHTDFPANFLDIGGGASAITVFESLQKVLFQEPKFIWMTIFGGITDCREVAQGILDFYKKNPNAPEVVIRMKGLHYEKAVTMLQSKNISCHSSISSIHTYISNILQK